MRLRQLRKVALHSSGSFGLFLFGCPLSLFISSSFLSDRVAANSIYHLFQGTKGVHLELLDTHSDGALWILGG